MRRLILILTGLTLLAIGTGYVIWSRNLVQNWLVGKAEGEIVRLYREKIEGHIPFQVESAKVERKWSDFVTGKIGSVSLTLRQGDLRADLNGALTFPAFNWQTFKRLYRRLGGEKVETASGELRIDYYPSVHFENKHSPAPPPIDLHVWAGVSGSLDELHDAGIEITPPQNSNPKTREWKWPAHGIELQNPRAKIHWSANEPLTAEFLADAFSFAEKSEKTGDKNVNLAQPSISFEVPLSIQPLQLGTLARTSWKARSAEALFGDHYFSAAEGPLHGRAEIDLRDDLRWKAARMALGKSSNPQVHLQLTPKNGKLFAELKSDPLSLKDTLDGFLKSTSNAGAPFASLAFLKAFQVEQGRFNVTAHAVAPLVSSSGLPDFKEISTQTLLQDASLRLEDASFLWPAKQLAIKKLNLDVPYRLGQGAQGQLAISRFGYRKLRGSLKPTWFSFQEEGPHDIRVRIGEKGSKLPLSLDGLILRVDAISGKAKLSPSLQYDLNTSARLEPVEVEKIARPLCLAKPGSRIMPGNLRLDFGKIDLAKDSAEITGSIRAELFGGSIQADQISAYDIFSDVPEVDLNVDMRGIDLSQMGGWVGFGEMDGTLQGYAHDVVFQSFLPTQYDFQMNVVPKNHSDVVFSPDAMKNFARIFAEEGIDHIPGIAQWFAFGLPSRLLGGYNIDYAGVHVHSEDGFIRLETLDPAAETETLRANQKHFILYGRRFKIPLKSSRYPLILDASAMGNFVHRKLTYLMSLSKNKKGETPGENSYDYEYGAEDSDTLPKDCVPTDLSHL